MPEQQPDAVHLIYELVLQEAHDVAHRCLERLHELNGRYQCPDQKELEQLCIEGASDAARPGFNNRARQI